MTPSTTPEVAHLSAAEAEIELPVALDGSLVISPYLAARYGLQAGELAHLEGDEYSLTLKKQVTHLAKVYIEPTNRCNLACRFCVRNDWNETLGNMSEATFARILDGIRRLPHPPVVFFGGFGEPLAHPHIVDMLRAASAVAASVELITNGTLLTEDTSRRLIEAGLDRLWISIDSLDPQEFSDLRLGAALPVILENVRKFRELRWDIGHKRAEIGAVFVAMKRNITTLPDLVRQSNRVGISYFMVTNLLPYTPELCDEILYSQALSSAPSAAASPLHPRLILPRLDLNGITQQPLYEILQHTSNVSFLGDRPFRIPTRCPFISKGSTAIAWDGSLSPCLALLHTHSSYWDRQPRVSKRYVVGNVSAAGLPELWAQEEYVDFRRRVARSDFAPCFLCGGCELAEKNEEDCYGNTFPTCGSCLWAQGVIQCP